VVRLAWVVAFHRSPWQYVLPRQPRMIPEGMSRSARLRSKLRKQCGLPRPHCPSGTRKPAKGTPPTVAPLLYHARSFDRRDLPWARRFVHSSAGEGPCASCARMCFRPQWSGLQRGRSPGCGGRDGAPPPKCTGLVPFPPPLNPIRSVLTAATLVHAIGAGITAGAGTRLVLQ